MDTVYNITIHIKTPEGMLEMGRFFIGHNHDFACATFNSLKGSSIINKHTLLRIDFLQTELNQLPVLLKSISCTLNEYSDNCKIITRDVFKYFTLET